jgi:hypothetical protein
MLCFPLGAMHVMLGTQFFLVLIFVCT